jgi:glycosyltransferase involved in cell wall biosynthesis
MSELKLSIIIPCYNVEKYIAQCLDSIYNQDISESEYEVICVNDCSKDKTIEIIRHYQNTHSNLIIQDHKINKLAGASRNTGLKVAKGKYIWFIDSDDFILSNIFSKLLYVLEKNNLEILQFNHYEVHINGLITEKSEYMPLIKDVISGLEYYKLDFPLYKRPVAPWCKVFDRNFLVVNELFFDEKLHIGEDVKYTLNALLRCERYYYINDIVYFYRKSETSLANLNLHGSKKLADKIIYSYDCIILLINWKSKLENGLFEKLLIQYKYEISKSKKSILYLPNKERKFFFNLIKDIDFNITKEIMTEKDLNIYLYPRLTLLLSSIFMPLLRQLRFFKRKLL